MTLILFLYCSSSSHILCQRANKTDLDWIIALKPVEKKSTKELSSLSSSIAAVFTKTLLKAIRCRVIAGMQQLKVK
jgi:hypothetical protein